MPEHVHEELAAYVLGRLDPGEEARFRRHLRDCSRCRAEEVELRQVSALLQDTAPSAPPAALEARTLAAVAALPMPTDLGKSTTPGAVAALPTDLGGATTPGAHSGHAPGDELARRRGLRTLGAVAAVAAGLALAFALGSSAGEDRVETVASLPGSQEKTAALRGDGFGAAARVNVIGEGRLVEVKSDTVPVIPKGTYYELWFVGPGDTRGRPNRVSAGTWHPDKRGITDVRFLVAADPALFPEIEVTREPPDGDPRPSGRVVLES